ncbi:MAG: N-acetyltransferase family protein [Elainellaceae cyanobacterium]
MLLITDRHHLDSPLLRNSAPHDKSNSVMLLHIRAATVDDLPSILEIYNDAIRNTTAVYSYDPVTLANRLEWFQTKQQHNYPVLVAETDSETNARVIGFSSYGAFRAWDAYLHTVENSIYVHPNYRGQGVGKQLLSSLIEQANTQNIHVIVAGIDAVNQASIRLHQSFGFVQVAHFKEVGFKFDRWLDLVFMQLILQ